LPSSYKSVPAIEKCFSVLDLLSKSQTPLGISDISRRLNLNKSTVFNLLYTLAAQKVLHELDNGKFEFGPRFYMMGNASSKRYELIHVVHPSLRRINQETRLSVFLGLRSGLRTLLIDKVDSTYAVKISSEVGMQLPVLGGVGIKAMLSLLDREQVERRLLNVSLRKYTPNTIVDKQIYLDEIGRVREEGIAFDREEYIEGISAVGVPLKVSNKKIQAAIWVVGLKGQLSGKAGRNTADLLKAVALEINQRLG